jgi:cupin 2 domain-containing protein
MTDVAHGRLLSPSAAPEHGERTEGVASVAGAVIEQIVSGALAGPVDYDQDHDEWALVLAGAAVLEVAGVRLDLTAGDWVLLPAHVPHRLVHVAPGTNWLTVRGGPPADTPRPPQ